MENKNWKTKIDPRIRASKGAKQNLSRQTRNCYRRFECFIDDSN